MSSKVNVDTLADYQDSARAYKWDVEISGFGGLNGETINLRCLSTGQPQPDFNVIETNLRGFTKVESGAVSWNPITLTPVEVDDYSILLSLYELGRQQFDYESGVQQKKNSYSGSIVILLQSITNAVPFSWQLNGCILENYQPPETSGEKNAVVNMPFTVRYDYAVKV